MIKHFTQRDFSRAKPPCKITDMNPGTLRRFDKAREIAGIPFVVNSAARTIAHELRQGRDGTSSHVFIPGSRKAYAMDIRATGSREKYLIVDALLKAGFTRIFLYKSFIHADDDPGKDQRVINCYP